MNLQLIVAFILLSTFSASVSHEENNQLGESKSKDALKKTSPINCYRYTSKSDTILLKVIHIGEAITGILVYNLEGKDKNKGTIQGRMRGDLLIADYTFMAEGISSIRQIAFKLKDSVFIEGNGETEVHENKIRFKNTDSIKFNDSIKLIEIPCQ